MIPGDHDRRAPRAPLWTAQRRHPHRPVPGPRHPHPLPGWLHDEGGLRLAVAFTAALLVLALVLAPIAAVLV